MTCAISNKKKNWVDARKYFVCDVTSWDRHRRGKSGEWERMGRYVPFRISPFLGFLLSRSDFATDVVDGGHDMRVRYVRSLVDISENRH